MLLRSALELIAVVDLIAILAVVSLLAGEPGALQALTGEPVRPRSPRTRPDAP
jgi:hypothetical protein